MCERSPLEKCWSLNLTQPESTQQISVPLRSLRDEANVCVAAHNSLDGLLNAGQHVQ